MDHTELPWATYSTPPGVENLNYTWWALKVPFFEKELGYHVKCLFPFFGVSWWRIFPVHRRWDGGSYPPYSVKEHCPHLSVKKPLCLSTRRNWSFSLSLERGIFKDIKIKRNNTPNLQVNRPSFLYSTMFYILHLNFNIRINSLQFQRKVDDRSIM